MILQFWLRIGLILYFATITDRIIAAPRQIPVVQQVGVIPVQWQGRISPLSSLSKVQALIDTGFSPLIRDSKRFHVLNDEIVMDHWEKADGRQILQDEYEMDAFVSLSIRIEEDIQVWTIRLMSLSLENYLAESERVENTWLSTASDQEIREKLRILAFRLLNRYPIDVFVTSTQGRYITLSAGTEQNLFQGQSIIINRYFVASIHPVNGSWLDYEIKKLGEAKIIDAKPSLAIAELKSLAYEGAIRVGDGARVDKISSRRLFADLNQKSITDSGSDPDSPIIPPKSLNNPSKNLSEKDPGISEKSEAKIENRIPQKVVDHLLDDESKEPSDSIDSDSHPPVPLDPTAPESNQLSFGDWLDKHLNEYQVQGGPDIWTYDKKQVSAKSKFPLWLVNRLDAKAKLSWDPSTHSEVSGLIGFGSTGSGGFHRFGVGVNWLKYIHIPGAIIHRSIDGFEVGGQANIRSLSVTSESFGGIDALELGGLIRLLGREHLIESGQTIEYKTGLKLALLSWGQAGLGGKKKSVSGMTSFGAQGEIILKDPGNPWKIGGFFDLNFGSYQTSVGRLQYQSWYFGIVGKTSL